MSHCHSTCFWFFGKIDFEGEILKKEEKMEF